jgi:hypothetical protein
MVPPSALPELIRVWDAPLYVRLLAVGAVFTLPSALSIYAMTHFLSESS